MVIRCDIPIPLHGGVPHRAGWFHTPPLRPRTTPALRATPPRRGMGGCVHNINSPRTGRVEGGRPYGEDCRAHLLNIAGGESIIINSQLSIINYFSGLIFRLTPSLSSLSTIFQAAAHLQFATYNLQFRTNSATVSVLAVRGNMSASRSSLTA